MRLLIITLTALVLWAGAWMLIAVPADAQNRNCGPRALAITGLVEKYGESRQMIGHNQQYLTEVWANLETGTWTVTQTDAAGMMCLRSSGQGYEAVSDPLEPAGERL